MVAAEMTSEYDCVTSSPFASVARIESGNVPAVDGVPARTPPDVKLMPLGSAPDSNPNEYGAVPPDAVSAWLYAVPLVPAGSADGVIAIVAEAITSEYDC